MQFRDIIQRVASKCDDPDQTYITPDYVMGFAQDTYEWLYGKLRLTGSQFDEETIILPAVQAGIPNLDSYMATGGMLATLVQPRIMRWKLPGQDPTYWQRANGPIDEVNDLTNAGEPLLDSWAFSRYSIKLSNFNTPLDLEITGEFLFDPLTSPDSQVEISATYNRTFSCKLAAEVGKARGNDKWVTTYEADADDSLDDLRLAMVKARQGITERVARMSRSGLYGNQAISPQV
jgi:hypothetical protein